MGAQQRLEIQVVPGESVDYPRVALLVDGRDVLAWRGEQGFGPEALLHTGDPLIPTDPPRRVALYHCGCGIAGCGTIACRISEAGGVVRWSGFSDFVGLDFPLDTSVADEHGRPLDLGDFAFDAAQYRAEVERAKADRSWETRRRRVARLLQSRLGAPADRWDALGFRFVSAKPWSDDEAVYAVDLRRGDDQLLIGLRAPARPDDETVVNALAADVLSGDERTWFVIYDQRHPSLPGEVP